MRTVIVAASMVAGLLVNAAGTAAQSARPSLPRLSQHALLAMTAGLAGAQESSPPTSGGRQSLTDAWWTGPMLANSAATLARGHFLIEPYIYDVAAAGSHGFGSRTYVLYGATDTLTVGLIPVLGFNKMRDGPNSSGIGLGDVTVLAQYRLTQFHPGGWTPATGVMVQQTFPTGKYDRLGDRPSDGFGGGAHTTTLALNSQMYFWLPNGRILRMRLDVSQALSRGVNVEGVSVYGTGAGFRGHAKPGGAFFADASWEYSLTRRWVLALDVTYGYAGRTRVAGYNVSDPNGARNPPGILLTSGSGEAFGFAPAIEYSWTPSLGVLLGVRIVPAGRNAAATITPALAINFVK